MSAQSVADTLLGAGLDPAEAPGKRALYERARSTFDRAPGASPACGYWIPGRLEFFGTHTDYAGGRTLVSALPRGFIFLGRARHDGCLRLIDAVTGESFATAPRAIAVPKATGSSDWRQYGRVVFHRLARNFDGASLGADLVFASDLPMAAGMSSSSALMVGVAISLVHLSGIRHRPEWQANIQSSLDEAGYYACIENGLSFGTLTGDAGVGTHGGSEDHAAMLCGTGGALTGYAFVPMRRLDTVLLPSDWRVTAMTSGAAAEKTGAARDAYNRLAHGAARLLELWNRYETSASSLAAALGSSDTAPARLHTLIRTEPVAGWSPEDLDARLNHFVREDARVPQALQAIRDRDRGELAAIAAASQADSERLLKNQVAETVALTRTALECGALAARSFGAGFGGSVWALTAGVDHAAFIQRWENAYRLRYPTTRTVGLLAHPGPPVVELAL